VVVRGSCFTLLLLAACSDSTANDGGPDALVDPDSGPSNPALATGVVISQIAEFQGVKIPLMASGALPAMKRAYGVANKAGLLRVYVKHDPAWMPRALRAVLDVTANGMTTSLTTDVPAGPDSTDDALASTINFDLTPELTTTDAAYAVRLVEVDQFAWPTTDPSDARWPVDGTSISLDTKSSGDQLHLTLVPIRYNFDGSGRLPDTSMMQLTVYNNFLYDTYPIPQIDLTVHAPVDYPSEVQANGTGWNALLQFVANLRQTEAKGASRYYYGLFEPAASFGVFCASGCVEGLAMLGTQPTDTYSRAAVGLGFTGNTVARILLQELAHNMGRQHAPCGGAQNVDPNYPYPNGLIGSWGYSLTFKSMRAPTAYKDFMSYCQPQWVSDYTYGGLFERIRFVNGASIVSGPTRAWRWATWDGKAITYGARFVGATPAADLVTLGGVSGHYYPFDSVAGGMLIVPD
jgi:hypothetical protein